MMKYLELVSSIVSGNCILFAGAGLTCDSGGKLWNDLITNLKKQFQYEGEDADNFDILDDIMYDHDPKIVYEYIQKQLCGAYIDQSLTELIKLPWFSVITTNYDVALEKALNKYHMKKICTLDDNYTFQLNWHGSELYCVKLMGSCDIPYGEKGSMVLTQGELEIAHEERTRIFHTLEAFSVNFSILFVGYSFNDEIFFDNLQKLEAMMGKPTKKNYALFLNEGNMDSRKKRKLDRYNVEPIYGDLKEFSKTLTREAILFDVNDQRYKKILYGSELLSLDPTSVGYFLSQFDPILYEDLNEDVAIKTFLRGQLHSFKPFENKWHFERKEINDIIRAILDHRDAQESNFIGVLGHPGSGKSFAIHAAVNKLIREHNSIAIKIRNSVNKIPSAEDLNDFITKLETSIDEGKLLKFERIILFSTEELKIYDYLRYAELSRSSKYPIDLLFESINFAESQYIPKKDTRIFIVDLGVELTEEETDRLADYLLEINKLHKLPQISKATSLEFVKSERNFLSLMYRFLDPAHHSINTLIDQKFAEIAKSNPKAKDLICLLCLSSFFKLPMPISILRKCFVIKYRKFDFSDLDELINETNEFVVPTTRPIPSVSIFHKYIAEYLVKIIQLPEMDKYLKLLADSVQLTSKTDADFTDLLFIDFGIRRGDRVPKSFTDEGLIKALFSMKSRQPARLVIHHLAKLCNRIGHDSTVVDELLEEALKDHPSELHLFERPENVMTTKADIEWERNKHRLVEKSFEDPETQDIISILNKAKQSHNPNVHPYGVHAKILTDFWKKADEGDEKFKLICETIDIITEGLDLCDPENELMLHDMLKICYDELNTEFSEENAESIFVEKRNGIGYYSLAKYHYNSGEISKAENFLDICLQAHFKPPSAIFLKLEILLKKNNPDYLAILKCADLITRNNGTSIPWKTAYHIGVTYSINGLIEPASRFFDIARKKSKDIANPLGEGYIFWMENGHRKIFTGRIIKKTRFTGWISIPNVSGWSGNIYFEPHEQKNNKELRVGNEVTFEVGYNLKGSIAFGVEPYKWKK